MHTAHFSILQITDTYILLCDLDTGKTVTNDAANVIAALEDMVDGIGNRHVYYRDTTGRYDELRHDQGRFTGFAPCSESQQKFFGTVSGAKNGN